MPGCQSHGAASGHHMEMCAAVLFAAVLLPPPTPSCPSNMNDRQVEQDSCGGMAASAFTQASVQASCDPSEHSSTAAAAARVTVMILVTSGEYKLRVMKAELQFSWLLSARSLSVNSTHSVEHCA